MTLEVKGALSPHNSVVALRHQFWLDFSSPSFGLAASALASRLRGAASAHEEAHEDLGFASRLRFCSFVSLRGFVEAASASLRGFVQAALASAPPASRLRRSGFGFGASATRLRSTTASLWQLRLRLHRLRLR
jgi:hypothetical protein